MAKTRKSFPKNPQDGDTISDKLGNVYIYDLQTDSWNIKGRLVASNIVTEQSDGLVSPDIYKKLQNLRELYVSKALETFKIEPSVNSYWYYFKSPSGLIRFKTEDANTIRMEVDRGRLINLILKKNLLAYGNPICIKGPKGQKGEKGDAGPKGDNGSGGGAEPAYLAKVINDTLQFEVPTSLSIDTNISVRIYPVAAPAIQSTNWLVGDVEKKHYDPSGVLLPQAMSPIFNGAVPPIPTYSLEIKYSEPSKFIVVKGDDIDVQASSLKFTGSTVTGSISLTSGSWSGSWAVKSAQKGPVGPKGAAGTCFAKPLKCIVSNTDIRALCPIVNARFECGTNVIRTFCAPLSGTLCVGKLRLPSNSNALSDLNAVEATFASVKVSPDDCKPTYQYSFAPKPEKTPKLMLADWSPQPGCVTKRHFNDHSFDWIPNTNLAGCNTKVIWLGPTEIKKPLYPWTNITAEEPERDLCCQDDFFYCPNKQTQECPKPAAKIVPPRFGGFGFGDYFALLMFDGKNSSVAIASLKIDEPLKIIAKAAIPNAATSMNIRLDAVPTKEFTTDKRMDLVLYGNESGVASDIDLIQRLKVRVGEQNSNFRVGGDSGDVTLYKPAKVSGLEIGSLKYGRFSTDKTAEFAYTPNGDQPYPPSELSSGGFLVYPGDDGNAAFPANGFNYTSFSGSPSDKTDGFGIRANVSLGYTLWKADEVNNQE